MDSLNQKPQLMRAAGLHKYNEPYRIQPRPIPQIRDTELLVRVCAAGFCHSDLQVLRGDFAGRSSFSSSLAPELPLVPSHEPAGFVAAVGPRCAGSWKVGDRVGVLNFKNACGECPGCKLSRRKKADGGDGGGRGKELDVRFCEKREKAGFSHDGALAEYMAADPATTVLLPDSISHEQAAPLMCAGATVWGGLEKASSLSPGDAVGIIGIGGLGHLGIQFAKAMGYRVVATDRRSEGRELANMVANPELKPDLVVDSTDEEAAAAVYDFTGGEGLAAVVMCTDSLEANAWGLTLLRIQGVLVVLGLPPEKWQFDPGLMVFKELNIQGSYVADTEATKRMMSAVDKHNIQSHLTIVQFEQVSSIIEAYQQASFKGRLVVQIPE